MNEVRIAVRSVTVQPAHIRVMVRADGTAVILTNDGDDVTYVDMTDEQREALIRALNGLTY